MDYKFVANDEGVFSVHNQTGRRMELVRDPIVTLLNYISGWEPIDGKIISTSIDLDEVARVAASFYRVPFISYAASKCTTFNEYIELGDARPDLWMDELGVTWKWIRSMGEMSNDSCEELMGMTIPQRLKLLEGNDGMNNTLMWRSLQETQNHTGPKPYRVGSFNCHIVETDHGSAFVTMAVDTNTGELVNMDRQDGFGSRIQAYKLNNKDWEYLWSPSSAIQPKDKIYKLVRDTLKKMYKLYVIPDEVRASKLQYGLLGSMGNTLLHRDVEPDLFEASVLAGESLYVHVLDILTDGENTAPEYLHFCERFGVDAYPSIAIGGVLFASHISDGSTKCAIYDGEYIKSYQTEDWFGDGCQYIVAKYNGEEYLVNKQSPVESLKKLGKEYVNEYRLFNNI